MFRLMDVGERCPHCGQKCQAEGRKGNLQMMSKSCPKHAVPLGCFNPRLSSNKYARSLIKLDPLACDNRANRLAALGSPIRAFRFQRPAYPAEHQHSATCKALAQMQCPTAQTCHLSYWLTTLSALSASHPVGYQEPISLIDCLYCFI